MVEKRLYTIAICLFLASAGLSRAGGDLPSKFSYLDNILNTRHNLTLSTLSGGDTTGHDTYRNNYGDVCVYCHTPNSTPTLTDLQWNHTIRNTPYEVYQSATLAEPLPQPGPNSMTCLSCHDGNTAVDSVIVFPDGRTDPNQRFEQNDSFLNLWANPSGTPTTQHQAMSDAGCLSCHNAGSLQTAAANFRVARVGVNLSDDHPVGARYPLDGTMDYFVPNSLQPDLAFFDGNSNLSADSNEIRLYYSAGDYRVECPSCHDPHGVPTSGAGSKLYPTFLRTANYGGSLCMTCHRK